MEDTGREDSYYHPSGVPITPQARRFGWEFPVYVSKSVWDDMCMTAGIPSNRGVSLEKRIWHLLQYCYEGMAKKLAKGDDFLYYEFKVFYWNRAKPHAKKMKRRAVGARLFLDPSTGVPWLYMFLKDVDSIESLERGGPPDNVSTETDKIDTDPEAMYTAST